MRTPARMVAGAFLVAACDPGETTVSHSVSRDSAGMRVVESRAPTSQKWHVHDEPALLVGSVGGAPETQFTDVRSVIRLSDGRLVVAVGRSQELRCFSANGTHLWTAGRAGQGPGDFVTLRMIAPYRGDSILAFDFGVQRYTVFDADGKLARTFTPEVPDEVDFYRNIALVGTWPDGSIALRHTPVRRGMSPPRVTRHPVRLYHYSPDGRLQTRLGSYPGQEFYEGEAFGILPLPFGRDTRFALLPDGFVVATDDAYELRRVRLDGSTAMIMRRPEAAREITAEFGRAEIERMRSMRHRERPRVFRGMPDSILALMAASDDQMFSTMKLPPSFPAYGRIIVSDSLEVWVERYRMNDDSTAHSWSVFAADGRWIADVALPARFTLHVASRDAVIGVQLDDDDVEYVAVYKLRRR